MAVSVYAGAKSVWITDYFLYEKYGWGKDWSRHDMGMQSEWKEKPSTTFPGKLNEATRLNPLFALKSA
ncbi:hypothetical protein [Janthinobacterium sp. GW458P]|uniref:hypothetical protein n=1 Tax=Janthinobacterium sp. GW458P TaxID=1981504 RepID=UPI001557A510|nr:hypothetical protein [Janthinobacterium sp. GW458P]MBE3025115.1 hypothetical protein [Janthinobacterium sp. GW458P]